MNHSPSQPHIDATEARATPGLLSPKRWTQFCLDLIFPPRCAGCGRVDTVWCARCGREIESAPLLTTVRTTTPPLKQIAATGLHAGRLQQAVHALKYEGVRSLADVLGRRALARLAALNWTFDMLVPVPLHSARLRQRGYNQSQLIAETIAAQLMIPCVPSALERRRDTRAQVGLSGIQRQQNMHDAFRGDPTLLSGHIVVLIDDVSTTGSTLAACALAARDAGALAVYGLTVTSGK